MSEIEKGIIDRCLAGDNGAFGAVVDVYQDRIYGFALRLLKDEAAAEDAAQETFLKAFRALSSYDPSYAFSSWLFRIAHNSCMDVLRTSGRTVSLDEEDFPDIPDKGPSVSDAVADALDSERIEALLSSLPPIYSEALLLRYREDMGPAEIARVTGVAEGTVKARLFRAREMLKERLSDATVPAAAAYYRRGAI